MRSDFSKILVERGRHYGPFSVGSYRAVRDRTKVEDDDAGFTQPMRRPYGYYDKEVNDLLGPLVRFIRSRVGARWDDVYGEVCAQLKGRGAVKQHVIDHLLQAVETNIGIGKHGEWIGKSGDVFDPRANRGPDYYVDPETGILSMVRRSRRSAARLETVSERKVDGRIFRKLAGIWYEIVMVEREGTAPCYGVKHVEQKRQLTGKELRAMNLANDMTPT